MMTSYSHIRSRVYDAKYSLNRTLSPFNDKNEKLHHQSLRSSIEKVTKISQEHYKQAMKHVKRFTKYQTERKKEKIVQDPECSFKPKLQNNNYKLLKQKCDLGDSKTGLLQKKAIGGNGGYKLDGDHSTHVLKKKSLQSPKDFQSTQLQPPSKNPQLMKKINRNPTYKTVERMMEWAQLRDSKIVNKTVENQISKTISPQTSYSGSLTKTKNQQRKGQANRESLTNNGNIMNRKSHLKLNIKIPEEGYHQNKGKKAHYSSYNNISNLRRITHLSAKVTPRTNELTDQAHNAQKSSGYYSSAQTPKTDRLLADHNDANPHERLTPIDSKGNYKLCGEKILAKQAERGEGSFYLRQARANVKKNYQGNTDLLVDRAYTSKFSYLP